MFTANRDMIDAWTPVHAAAGFLAGLMGFPRPLTYLGFFGVEAAEILLAKGGLIEPESRGNRVADLGFGIAGFEAGIRLSHYFAPPEIETSFEEAGAPPRSHASASSSFRRPPGPVPREERKI